MCSLRLGNKSQPFASMHDDVAEAIRDDIHSDGGLARSRDDRPPQSSKKETP